MERTLEWMAVRRLEIVTCLDGWDVRDFTDFNSQFSLNFSLKFSQKFKQKSPSMVS
jgi:hypothetical protein